MLHDYCGIIPTKMKSRPYTYFFRNTAVTAKASPFTSA